MPSLGGWSVQLLRHAGARQLTLDGVYHSPLGSVASVEGAQPGRPWCAPPGATQCVQKVCMRMLRQ